MITDPFLLLFALLAAHFLCDFPLQGQFMSDAKNCSKPIKGVAWWYVLFGHCVIHGAAVALITGYWFLGLLEMIAHFLIDLSKCKNIISFGEDQTFHLICKFWFFVFCILRAQGF